MSYVRSFWHLCLHLGKPQYFEGFPASDSFGQSILEHLPSVAFFFKTAQGDMVFTVFPSNVSITGGRRRRWVVPTMQAGGPKECDVACSERFCQRHLLGEMMGIFHDISPYLREMTPSNDLLYTGLAQPLLVRIDLNVCRKSRSFKIQSAYLEDTLW